MTGKIMVLNGPGLHKLDIRSPYRGDGKRRRERGREQTHGQPGSTTGQPPSPRGPRAMPYRQSGAAISDRRPVRGTTATFRFGRGIRSAAKLPTAVFAFFRTVPGLVSRSKLTSVNGRRDGGTYGRNGTERNDYLLVAAKKSPIIDSKIDVRNFGLSLAAAFPAGRALDRMGCCAWR